MSFMNKDARGQHQLAVKLKDTASDFRELLNAALCAAQDGLGVEREAAHTAENGAVNTMNLC